MDLQHLPSAAVALLDPLKASTEFVSIAPRLAENHHVDSWQEDELHFFVFRLQPSHGAGHGHGPKSEAPVAVFVMHAPSQAPVSAVVVTPRSDGMDAEILDLRLPEVGAAINSRMV